MTKITPIQELFDLIESLRARTGEDLLTRGDMNLHLDRLEAATRQVSEIVHNGQPLRPSPAGQREDAVRLVCVTFDVNKLQVWKGGGVGNAARAREAAAWLRLNVEKRDRGRVGEEFYLAPAGLAQLERSAQARLARDPSFRAAVVAIQRILEGEAGARPDTRNVLFFPQAEKEARNGH